MPPTLEAMKDSLRTQAIPNAAVLGRWRCDSCMPTARLEIRFDLLRCLYLCDPSDWDGYGSQGRQLSLVFVFGIDVVMLNIPIPVRQ